jgi:diadenylate cyclase
MLATLKQLVGSYEWYQMLIEMAVIWVGVYLAFRFLKGTRGAGVIKGFAVFLIVATLIIRVLAQVSDAFGRLNFIYERFLGLLAILLIVVFQPELRQAMSRLGQARWFRPSRTEVAKLVDAVSEAVGFLSKSQFGAIIAIERSVQLGTFVQEGVAVDAEIDPRLLESIFWPNNPLHDLGVVIRGNRIAAASVQFPLAEEGSMPASLGARHRAAVGVTLDSDCLVVVVSEESGSISIAEHGRLTRNIARDRLADVLRERLAKPLKEAPEQKVPVVSDEGAEEPARKQTGAADTAAA